TDVTVVTATSAFNPEVYDTAQDTTIVARPHFQLFPDYTREVRGGLVVTNTHMLLNDGVITDSYTLAFGEQLAWPLTVTPTVVSNLGPGEAVPVTMTQFVPDGTRAGTVNTTAITATSQGFPILQDTAVDVTIIPF